MTEMIEEAPTVDELPPVGQVSRERILDQIYHEIRAGLMSGRFRPGQRLKLRPLAAAFGTSPLPVRDALGRLVAENALAVLPNRTVIVPWLTPERIDDLFDVRIVLEGHAAERAAKHMTNEALDELRRLNAGMAEQIEARDYARYFGSNQAFHFKIYRAARSPSAIRIIEGLWLQAGPLLTLIFGTGSPTFADEAQSHHQDVIDAIACRDSAAAGAAIAADLRDGAKFLRSKMKEAAATEAPTDAR